MRELINNIILIRTCPKLLRPQLKRAPVSDTARKCCPEHAALRIRVPKGNTTSSNSRGVALQDPELIGV